MPCVIDARWDEMTDAEKAAAYKATWWAGNITNAEWPALLGHEGASKYAKSRLKRKLVGWLMAMGRIAALNPDLLDQALREARDLYAAQLEDEHPLMILVDGGPLAGHHLLVRDFDTEVADGPQPDGGGDQA